MLGVYWPAVNRITIVLYALIILFLPFSPTISTILLFGLFSFWTRLPGVGTPVIGWWLLIFDTVDIFSILIAIHIGGFMGAIFSVIVNLSSAAIGKYTDWNMCTKDAIGQFIVCLIIPVIYQITNNIFSTIMWYSILRAFMFIPMRFVYSVGPFPKFVFELVAGTLLLTTVNGVYAGIFGSLFDTIIKEGVKFNWFLFLIVSVVIGIAWYYFKHLKVNQQKIYAQS